MKKLVFTLVMVAGLVACGDKPQVLESSKKDNPAYTGTGKAFANQQWKQGDKASWEAHMKTRTQYVQNDYARMN